MNNFDKYYGKSDAELTDEMKELTLKKVTRGFGSTIDQLEEEKINLEKRLIDLRINIANGNTGFIVSLGEALIEMGDLNQLIVTLVSEQKAFVG